jgi:hypothetical protein
MDTAASHLATSNLPDSLHDSTSGSSGARRRLMAWAMALLLVPIAQGALWAQQGPDNGQSTPDQQQGYPQPGSNQPAYGQQGNSQAQPYGQPPYGKPSPAQGQPVPPQDYGQNSGQAYGQTYEQGSEQRQPLNAQALEQLVAPIALYPDKLVAQVLTAATYPAQVSDAEQWLRSQGNASSDEIVMGADAQPWDPSVKALTAFPQVLAQMDQNQRWTTDLGNAYYNQPQDVLEAVQAMRQRAQAAGNLRSTPQETVNYDQGNIVLAPVNPQVVYVPSYNPWAVYGQPVTPYPGFSLLGALGSFFGSSVRFGLGMAMTAFSHSPWGWLGWGLNWLTQSVLFHDSNYFSHSNTVADWGLPHGGPRYFSRFSRGSGFASWSNGPYRTRSGYGWSGRESPANRSREFSRTPERDARSWNRPGQTYSRAYPSAGANYGRTSRDAYNRFQPTNRQEGGRSGYGSGFNNRPAENRYAENFGNRAGYGNSMRSYQSPSRNSRADSGKQSSRGFKNGGFKGNGFAESSGKHAHFGGGHERAPKTKSFASAKSFGGGKSFSRGHSGGGGHSGGHGHGGGKHHG